MTTKRNYRRVKVNKVSAESLKELALVNGNVGTTVGLDVAKEELVVVVRWPDGRFERPWSVRNPTEIALLVDLLCVLRDVCDSLVVGLESTGTYSEAIRFAMTQASLNIHRLSGKGVSDYKEIFDGVPSQHDGKAPVGTLEVKARSHFNIIVPQQADRLIQTALTNCKTNIKKTFATVIFLNSRQKARYRCANTSLKIIYKQDLHMLEKPSPKQPEGLEIESTLFIRANGLNVKQTAEPFGLLCFNHQINWAFSRSGFKTGRARLPLSIGV